MNEIFDIFNELPFEILGFAISVIVPLGILAAIIDWRTSKYEKINEFDAQRMEDNLLILENLKQYIEDNPSQRFGQALRNCGIIEDVAVRNSSKTELEHPDYYISRSILFEEPVLILERIEKTLASQYDYDMIIKENKK